MKLKNCRDIFVVFCTTFYKKSLNFDPNKKYSEKEVACGRAHAPTIHLSNSSKEEPGELICLGLGSGSTFTST